MVNGFQSRSQSLSLRFRGSYGTYNKSIGDIDIYTEFEKLMEGNLQYLTPLSFIFILEEAEIIPPDAVTVVETSNGRYVITGCLFQFHPLVTCTCYFESF